MVVNESLSTVNNTYTDMPNAVQKLMGFLDQSEPHYKHGSLHSFIHYCIGYFLAGISKNSGKNYEQSLGHFGQSLDELNFDPFASCGIWHCDHI